MIELAMKPPSGFEPAKTEFAISHYSFIVTNWCIKDLKYKLFKKYKYLHPIRTSDYSNSVSFHLQTKIVPIHNWNTPVVKCFNYHSSIRKFSIPHPTVLKVFKLSSTGNKKLWTSVLFKIFNPSLSIRH